MAKILIVDDQAEVRDILRRRLSSFGHSISVEADGAAGLFTARALEPDVILLDWMMPEMTGIEVCEQLRADPRFASTVIIMLTSRTEPEDLLRGEQAGVTHYVAKPFSVREVASCVQLALAGQPAQSGYAHHGGTPAAS